jgi:hypothetical protein
MKPDDIIQALQSIRLSNHEKASIRASLKAAIRNSAPVRVGVWRGLILWSHHYKHYQLHFRFMPILIILALVLGGGGISYAAEGSLPGDMLYPVKVSINEPVRGFVAFSDEAKISWNIERVERRFNEAEELAVEKRLSADTRATLQGRFKDHSDDAQLRIKNVASSDPEKAVELSSSLETTIKAHSRILGSIGLSLDGDTDTHVKLILKDADDEESDTRKERESAREAILSSRFTTTVSAAEGKKKAAENKLAEVSAFVKAWEEKNGTTTAASARLRLEGAQKVFANGDVELKAQSYEKAFLLFQEAHSMAQEVKLLLNAKMRFEKESDHGDDKKKTDDGKDVSATSSNKIKGRSDSDEESEGDKRSEEVRSNRDASSTEVKVEIETKGRLDEDKENESQTFEGSGKIKIDLGELDF